jgi:rhamnose transport system permease protein
VSAATPEPQRQRVLGGLGLRAERVRELSLVIIIAATVFIFGLIVENLWSGRFFVRVTTGVAIIALLAAGQTVVVITRNIDLSVGSMVGVTAYLTGEYLASNPSSSALEAIALAALIGCAMGLLNGALVAYGGIPAIIVTLGMLAVYRTLLIEHAEAQNITVNTLPDWLLDLSRTTVVSLGEFNIRFAFALAVVVVLVLQFCLGRLRWGRWFYAVGSNPEASRQAGLPIRRVTLGAFALSGTMAGLAGFLFLLRFGTITVHAGAGLELASVAAVVVGGVSILGGSGTVIGAFLGALLIDLLNQSLLRVPQVSEFWRDALLGALILAAVASDFFVGKRLGRSEPGSRLGSQMDTPSDRGAIADA